MRADNEIRQYARAHAAGRAIGFVSLAGQEQRGAAHRLDRKRCSHQYGLNVFHLDKTNRNLRIDDIVDCDPVARRRALVRRKRPWLPNRVVGQKIKQDVGIDKNQRTPIRRASVP